jgi:hypothetical protein
MTSGNDCFLVEHGIPLPADNYRYQNALKGGRTPNLPWHRLEPGDSVLVPSAEDASAGRLWATRHARTFVVAKQPDSTGWRVWRKA